MGWKIVVVSLLLTTSLATGSLPATANEPPQVDAGLDQRVYAGATVLLDGSGTRDPDGTITDYRWRIETPSGATITPDCPTCVRTRFTPTGTGTYDVTLRATDDDGATRNDTLYVTVRADDGPDVTIQGPSRATTGSTVQFEARTTPGSEPITDVQWLVDGTTVQRGSNTTLTRTPDDTGPRTVKVVVTDAIGRTSNDTRRLRVTNGTPGGPTNPIFDPGNGTGDPGNRTGSGPTLADQYQPTIDGAQLVTGDEPLEATYQLDAVPSGDRIRTVEWIANGDPVATSAALDATWTPGNHTLEARVTYDDGSADTARFPDGSTTVTADPAPEPELEDPTVNASSLFGSFDAVDDYGNLRRVSVTVNDTTVYATRLTEPAGQVSDDYSFDEVQTGENYTVTLSATDARGQTRTVTRSGTATSGPQVVSAGFIQDTTDSFHPRIDSARYTAEHVVEIELNGYPASEVSVLAFARQPDLRRLSANTRRYNRKTDTLIITSEWAGNEPDEYRLKPVLKVGESERRIGPYSFQVTPSPPELRLTSPGEGTKRAVKNWGMIVDASGSFDPDETRIEIDWLRGAQSIPGREFVAKLDPYKRAGVRVIDQSGASATENGSFLSYYVPRIQSVVETSEGPYNASEPVNITVRTDSYAFTKNDKRYNISLDARSNSSAVRIQSVTKRDVPADELSNYDAIKQRLHRWVVELQVPASALNDSEHWVTIYNEDNPERIYVSEELGDVQLRFSNEKQNLSVEEVLYSVRNESGVKTRRVSNPTMYRKLLSHGWRFSRTSKSVDSVTIETLQEEKRRRIRTRNFSSEANAREFTRLNPSWTYSHSERYEETVGGLKTEWVRDKTKGRPTGETRRVVSNPDAFHVEREFEYQTQVQDTEVRSVEVEVEKTVTRYRTVKKTVCKPRVGCYVVSKEVAYQKTITVTKTVKRKVTVTRTVTRTYWAKQSRSRTHSRTGDTRKVRTEPREYVTEYEVQVPFERTVTKERHVTSKAVTETVEVWQHDTEVESLQRARSLARNPDTRIGTVYETTTWILAKNGTVTEISRTYDNKGNVVKTYATVTGVLVYGPESDDTRQFEIQIEINGHATEEKILNEAMERSVSCDGPEEECNA